MGLVSDRQKEEIRERVRLDELARDYGLVLKRTGDRCVALCPFHNEKTPSFHIRPDQEFFHCFGCKKSGDVFDFVRFMEHVTFPEALEILARKAGIALEFEGGRGQGPSRGEKTAIFDALGLAADFYHHLLMKDPRGEMARRYLLDRGIPRESWEKFQLGYTLPDWDAFLKVGLQKGLQPEILEKAGLVRASQRGGTGFYDYFRGRVMFPIADAMKRVIGFGARTLGDDQPKYLNTSRTPVFDKSQVLYGLPLARAGIEREGRLAIVEGYTDAIVAHQEGLDFVVASLGTAFTSDNARRLRRLAPRVDLIFDGDDAGQGAAERSVELLVAEEIDVRIYSVVDGKDPCDALLAMGGEKFRQRLDSDSVGIFEFKWRRTIGSITDDQHGAAATARALDEVLALLNKVPNVVMRKLYAQDFAERLGISVADVAARLRKMQPRSPVRSEPENRPAPESAPDPNAAPSLEEVVLECLLSDPGRAAERLEDVPDDFFNQVDNQCIARAIARQVRDGSVQPGRLMGILDMPEASMKLASILARVEDSNGASGVLSLDSEEKWSLCLVDIRRAALLRKRRELEGLKVQARAQGDKEGLLEAERQYIRVLRDKATT